MMLGWECPRCHTCYAPHIERCGNCRPQTWASNGATGLPIPSVQNWVLIVGGLAVLWFVTQPSGSSYRAERKKLRAKYAGYRQVTRKTGAALSAV